MKIIYMMGKSSSGKDTIFGILKKRLDVSTYVMYTDRPKREGEVDGEAYNFLSKEDMKQYVEGEKKNQLIESRTYQTVQGPWTYATIADKQFTSQKDMIMLGTLESYSKIKEYFCKKDSIQMVPIYIEVPDRERLKRAIKREDEEKDPHYLEICRRFVADSHDFSEENIKKAGIQKRFQNNDLYECVKEIADYLK